MYKIKVTSLAEKELSEIIVYISQHLKNPAAATRFLDEVAQCYGRLKDNPMQYEFCRDDRLSKLRYRKVVIKNYVLIYRVEDMSKTVYILHLFYGRRDYQKLI